MVVPLGIAGVIWRTELSEGVSTGTGINPYVIDAHPEQSF
jgi:hypothetical protein